MTQAINDPVHSENRRRQWVARVETLIDQISQWATAEGWAIARTERSVNERSLGQYQVPLLRVRLPSGELHFIPVGLNVIGAEGRVDIEAFPALNRVKLIGHDHQWEIYTDSNIPLRQPWNRETFARLAQDLLA
jgi:hypothetical protein